MIENIDIIFRAAHQSLYFDAPEGIPSSITSSEVFENCYGDDAEPVRATAGTALCQNISTTFSALSGDREKNARIARVDDSTGFIVGRRYLAIDTGGEREWVEAREVRPSIIEARLPMRNSYQPGDRIFSTRIDQPLSHRFINDESCLARPESIGPRYRWRIEYVHNCKTYVHAVNFDLVRYSSRHTVTINDVDRVFNGFSDSLSTRYREGAHELISEAYRQVKLDMFRSGRADQLYRNQEVIDDLVIHKTAYLGIQSRILSGAPIDPTAVDLVRDIYNERFDGYINNASAAYDSDGDGGKDETKRIPILRR